MRTIDTVTQVDYSLLIDGNGGEDQAIICTSAGQAGKTALIAVFMSVDMGGAVHVNTLIPTNEVLSCVADILRTWTHEGTKPTEEQSHQLLSKIEEIVHQYYVWGK